LTERGHPVRLSAKREQPAFREATYERAAHAGGQDVRAPLRHSPYLKLAALNLRGDFCQRDELDIAACATSPTKRSMAVSP